MIQLNRAENFTTLNLHPQIIAGLDLAKYIAPTEIQSEAIPLLLESVDQDFVGQAQTGTGKTAAFVLPLLHKLLLDKQAEKKSPPKAIILLPTRELAIQVFEELNKLASQTNIKAMCIYGGSSYERQIQGLRKHPQIIVGTPGRVIDLLDKGLLHLSEASHLILDEADEMLKMGFIDDVKKIMEELPEDRNIWMFSATLPRPISELIKREFRNPNYLKVKKETLSNADIEQIYFLVRPKDRPEALYRIIQSYGQSDFYAMVFCRTRLETKDLTVYLQERGVKVEALSGELSQGQREHTMARFRSGKIRVLICTDVAARGIDVHDLTHVINYGLPQDIESYVHRIGRTGRAGKKGMALSLIDPRDQLFIQKINRVSNSTLKAGQLPKIERLKECLIENKLKQLNSIVDSVKLKRESFIVDPSYALFAEAFGHLNKEEVQKIFFTHLFNRDLLRLNEMGEISVELAGRAGGERRGRTPARGGVRGARKKSNTFAPKRRQSEPKRKRVYK